MKAAQLDDKRRLVMPPDFRAGEPVTLQQVDADSWLVRRSPPPQRLKLVVLPVITRLEDDAEWDKTSARIAREATRRMAPFEE